MGYTQNIVVTQRGFALESPLLANNPHAWKVNGRLAESKREVSGNYEGSAPRGRHHPPPFYHPRHKSRALRPPEALRMLLVASGW